MILLFQLRCASIWFGLVTFLFGGVIRDADDDIDDDDSCRRNKSKLSDET